MPTNDPVYNREYQRRRYANLTIRAKDMKKRKEWLLRNRQRYNVTVAMSGRREDGLIVESILRLSPEECEVCGTKEKLVCDHDHKTGKFRGWLCSPCNIKLGHLEKNPELNEKLLEYAKREAANNAGILLSKSEFIKLHYDTNFPIRKK